MRPNLDTRILALAPARMVDALANSFLVVVPPLYIESQLVSMPSFVGTTLSLGVVEVPLSTKLPTGVVLSLFGFLNSFSQPFTGSLSGRTGRHRVFLLAGLAPAAVGSAGYLVFMTYGSILVMRTLQGLGVAFIIPVTVALVNELSDEDERGGNFGLLNTFRLLGFGTGPPIAGGVVTAGPYSLADVALSGFDAAFLVAVVGAVVSFVLIVLLIGDPGRTDSEAADDISISVQNPDDPGLDPVFALSVATIVMVLSIAIYAPLANAINECLDQGTFLFSVQSGATAPASVVFQYPIGRLSDRYGRRPFLVGGFVLLLPTTFAQGFVQTPALMIFARFLQGAAVAAVSAPSLALAGDIAKMGRSGSTLSLLTMEFGLGVAIGALFPGVLIGFGFAVPFMAATALGTIGLLLIYTQVGETVEVDGGGGDSPSPTRGD